MGHEKRLCFFDADCGVCGAFVRLGERWDRAGRIEFIPNYDLSRLPSDVDPALVQDTIVVVADGQTRVRARAVAGLLAVLPLGFPLSLLLRLPLVSFIADRLYRVFSRNRHTISARLGMGVCGIGEHHRGHDH